jgi:hypothetical protein
VCRSSPYLSRCAALSSMMAASIFGGREPQFVAVTRRTIHWKARQRMRKRGDDRSAKPWPPIALRDRTAGLHIGADTTLSCETSLTAGL